MLQRFQADARFRGDSFQIRVGNSCGYLAAFCLCYESANRKRDQAFGAGFDWNPLIRFGSRLRHPGLKLDEGTSSLGVSTAHLRICPVISNGRQPGLEEVCAKRKNEIRIANIEERQRGLPKKILRRAAQGSL